MKHLEAYIGEVMAVANINHRQKMTFNDFGHYFILYE